jgi:hypothetical protein
MKLHNREHFGHRISLLDYCTDLQKARFSDDGTLEVIKSVEWDVQRHEVYCEDCEVKLKVKREKIEYTI